MANFKPATKLENIKSNNNCAICSCASSFFAVGAVHVNDNEAMESRERVTVAATLPHLSQSRGTGGGTGAGVGGVTAEGMYRNMQSNGNVFRGSTLERPAGRTVVHPQASAGSAGHLVTTTADVEHHQPRPDLRSPLPPDSSPYPVFDTNQVKFSF